MHVGHTAAGRGGGSMHEKTKDTLGHDGVEEAEDGPRRHEPSGHEPWRLKDGPYRCEPRQEAERMNPGGRCIWIGPKWLYA